MPRFYITFGQAHAHAIAGITYDRNCLAEIEAENKEEAHNIAMDIFKKRFHNCHTEAELPSVLEYYPRGIIKV